MKRGAGTHHLEEADEEKPKSAKDKSAPKPVKRHKFLRRSGIVLLFLIFVLGCGRAMLPWTVRRYVNRTLDRSLLYSGTIGEVEIHLLRGAYSIRDIQLSKTTGNVPVPFFAAKRVDFAIQWDALLHHRIVAQVVMDQPQINFVDSPSDADSQTGAGGPWLQMIQDLSPFTVNSAVIRDGSIHFRTFQSTKPVDVYLSQVQGTLDDLSNIRNETTPMVAKVQATALAMDQAKFDFKMTLDPFSYRPTFHLGLRLIGLDVTKINDLALAYGKFDFKRGWFDLVLEADSQEGRLSGYVKPLFRDLKVFSIKQDIKEDSVLRFFWQALVGAASEIFRNQPRNQLGTLIPFTGDATNGTTTDTLATIGNLLRNAFIRAYLPRLENGQDQIDGLQFEPPDLSAPISAGSP